MNEIFTSRESTGRFDGDSFLLLVNTFFFEQILGVIFPRHKDVKN